MYVYTIVNEVLQLMQVLATYIRVYVRCESKKIDDMDTNAS